MSFAARRPVVSRPAPARVSQAEKARGSVAVGRAVHVAVTFLLCVLPAAGTAEERNPDIAFAGPPPGKAEVWTPEEETIGLANAAIAASWSFRNGNLRPARLRDGLTGREYDQTGAEVFRLTTVKPAAGDGPLPPTPVRGGQMQAPPFPGCDLAASRFTLAEPPAPAALEDGQALEADLVSPHGVRVRWRAELRDGAHYLRQTLSLTSPRQAFPLHGVEFTDLRLPGLATDVDEPTLLDAVRAFDAELVKKRGVPVRSYLVDDGWDDPAAGLWVENARRFPHGFAGTRAKMAPLGARLGIWISPLGGYGGAEARTAHARTMGLIPEGATLDLAHPAYRRWFTDRCL